MRNKDAFWEHVEEKNGRSFCKYCNQDFAGRNINRIKLHLARPGRGFGIKGCPKVPDHVRHEARANVGDLTKKPRLSASSSHLSSSSNLISDTIQPSFLGINKINHQTLVLHSKLARYLIHNNISSGVVESQSFIDFVSTLVGGDSKYKLPSRFEIEKKFFPQIRLQVERYIESVRESWKEGSGCSILLEKCSNFINLMIYSPKGTIFINQYEMDLEMITKDVTSIIEEHGVYRFVQIITSSDELVNSIGQFIKANYPTICHIQCVAEEIHSLLKAIYDEVECVRLVMDNVELIIKYIYGDVNILSMMRYYTKGRDLKHPCTSKFASKFQMLQSIFDNKTELQQLVASEEWNKLDSNHKISEMIKSTRFWSEAEEVAEILKPVVNVLRLVEDERPTSGYLYEAMKRSREEIKMQHMKNGAARILELIEERSSNIIQPIHVAAACLNPAYMFGKEWDTEMYNGMNYVLEKLVESGNDRYEFTKEMQRYLVRAPPELNTTMSLQIMESSHPCAWWMTAGGPCLKVLTKYAIRILSQPCKCSCSTLQVTEKKNTRSSHMLNLRLNAILMDKFGSMEEIPSRINLENCNELPDYVLTNQDSEDLHLIQLINPPNFDHDVNNETNVLQSWDELKDKDVITDWLELPKDIDPGFCKDKEMLEMFISNAQFFMSHLVEGANVEMLKNIIGHVQEKISLHHETTNQESEMDMDMMMMDLFSLQNMEANKQLRYVQSGQMIFPQSKASDASTSRNHNGNPHPNRDSLSSVTGLFSAGDSLNNPN